MSDREIINLKDELSSPLMDDISEMDDVVISNKYQIKWVKLLSQLCGYANAPSICRLIVGCYILLMNILVVQQASVHHGYCIYLNLYLIIMQIESLIVFIFGVMVINNKFMTELTQHLSIIGHSESKKLFKYELTLALIWILCNYISGYIGINDNTGTTESGLNDIWDFLWYYSCITDFIKYIACFTSISLIRLYFNTFTYKLKWLRVKLNVMRRNSFVIGMDDDDELIADFNKFEMELLKMNNNSKLKKRQKSIFRPSIQTTTSQKTYVTDITITHHEFKHEFQKILYFYRKLGSNIKYYIVTYLLMNSLCFIFVSITIIKLSSTSECNINSKYYIHYILELSLYFLGWILLIIPLAENHRLLRSFQRDLIATKVFDTPIDQILIHQYLSSCVEASPFSIGYMTPTYSRIMFILYAVFIIIGGQLISFYHVA